MGNRSTLVKQVDGFVDNSMISWEITITDGVLEVPSRYDQDLVNKSDVL